MDGTGTIPMAREVRVAADAAALSRLAAEFVVRAAQEAIGERGRVAIALAGGSTPRALYERLAEEPARSRMPWARVHVFWGDERCVPPTQPESNCRLAHEALLSRVPIPASNIHPVPVEGAEPAAAAQAYEETLREWFRIARGAVPVFDLLLLGLGADGHTAALFPGTPATREASRLVIETRGGRPDVARVTLTVPVLNRARRILWLVTGAGKASIVRRVLEDVPPGAQPLPAQLVQPVDGAAVWWLDRDAAAELPAALMAAPRED